MDEPTVKGTPKSFAGLMLRMIALFVVLGLVMFHVIIPITNPDNVFGAIVFGVLLGALIYWVTPWIFRGV